MGRLEDELQEIREEIEALSFSSPPVGDIEPTERDFQIAHHLIRGEEVPYDLVPEDDGLRPYLPVIREMIEEGDFDEEVEEDSS